MSGNGLYGYTANANVAVGNTTGLYIGGGNVKVLTNAQQLYNLLANSSSIGFELINTNQNVTGIVLSSGVTAGTYGSSSLIPIVTVGADGRVTSVSTVTVPTQSGTYSNTNVAAYLTGTITVGNLITNAGVYWSNGAPYSSGSGTIYGNANVAAYLPTYTGTLDLSSTIIGINANVAGANAAQTTANTIQSNQINALTSGQTAANVNIQTISANLGAFETYANANFVTAGALYSNTNVAAYLTTATITTTGNITGANLTTTGNVTASYVKGSAALLTALTGAAAGVYGSDTLIPSINVDATGRILSITTNAVSGGGSYGNTNVAAYLGSNAAIAITTTANIKTYANVISPNYLFANGVNILSTITSGGASFNGNLSGNTLIDTVNGRVIVNASPFSGPSTSGPLWTNLNNNNPVYVNGVLQAAAQVTGGATSFPYFVAAVEQTNANLGVQSSYQTSTARFTSGKVDYTQVWPVTANTMTGSDRYRGVTSITEVVLNNASWATALSQLSVAIANQFDAVNIVGTGTLGSAAGLQGQVYVTPNGSTAGSGLVANITYATGVTGGIQLQTTYGSTQTANITYARGFLPTVITNSSNHVITNAVGLHTPSGWVTAPGGNGAGIANRYVVLNEDANSLIQTNANIVFTPASGKALVFGDGTSISTVPVTQIVAGTNITISPTGGTSVVTINANTQASTYSNTNVAAYLTTATISTTGNITGGNVIATSYVQGDGSKLTNLPVQAGTYSNTNVTALLSAGISTNIVTTANVNAGNVNATGNFYGNLIAANVLVSNIGIQQYTSYNSVGAPNYAAGVLWYDTVQDSIAYYSSITNNEVNVGQELQFNAYNGTGSQINQGVPVYLTGGSFNNLPNVAPAIANTIATAQVAGVANQNIPANSTGAIVTVGVVANVSMGSFSTGDTLYLSPYSAGQVQNTVPPTGYVTKIGTVLYNNSPNGRFLVNKTVPVNNQTFGNLTVTGNITGNNASITNLTNTGNLITSGTATLGNIITTNGVFWANGTAYSAGGGTYANVNVSQYLPHATGYTDGWQMPIGGNSARPTFAANGMIRYNSDTENPEWYNGVTSTWYNFSQAYTIPPSGISTWYVVVGGGGAGGGSIGGGGGAGGYLEGNVTLTSGTTYTVVVGAGGAGVSGQTVGNSGTDSTITALTLDAIGGGGGASWDAVGPASGGSGGGGHGGGSSNWGYGTGTVGQGNNGGAGLAADNYGGGGGGANAVGVDAVVGQGGNGGAGKSTAITGSSVTLAGGGGGGSNGGPVGTGGAGGGGNANSGGNGSAGSANTGGGGGSNPIGSTSGGGGSGVVILRVLTSQYSGTTTGSPTITTTGSYTVIKFTSSGSYTA